MKVFDIEYTKYETYNHLSASIGKHRFWYRFPSTFDTDPLDASCFVCVALVPAMLLGEDLLVDEKYTISSRLYDNIDKIQEIYHCWNPIFKRIKVVSNTRALESKGSGCGSFFSAGVDATYSLLKHASEIEHLVLINGFDFPMPTQSWNAMVERNKSYASKLGKNLVPVETNRTFFKKESGLAGSTNFGACLASVAYVLGLTKAFISDSETYRWLIADGAHPLLCPLWSTEKTSVVHTGLEADRAKKLQLIGKNRDAVSNLWVCWDHPDYNCGRCSKCIRTYIALRLNDIEGCSFRNKVNISDVAKQSIRNELDLSFYLDFLRIAKEKGDDQVVKVINRLIGRYKIKRWIADMDRYYCSCVIKRAFLKLRYTLDKLRGRKRAPMRVYPMPEPDDLARLQIVKSNLANDNYKPKTVAFGSIFLKGGDLDKISG